MKIELQDNNKVILLSNGKKLEIHPLWLRERVNNKDLVDQLTEQRIYDPTTLNNKIKIKKAYIDNIYLKVEFSDGISSFYNIKDLCKELDIKNSKCGPIKKRTLWDSSLINKPIVEFQKNFESKETLNMLKKFYEYGFVIIKNVPTENNFIINFANSIGSIRPTNFGVYFDVKSIPNYNDLAYTSKHLLPHTDNPYRKPVPCVQLLHCIENEVSGGFSTLVDGFKVASFMRENYKDYFDILTSVKVRFRFVDKDIILENWGELLEIDEENNLKQVRYNTKIEYVPHINKDELDLFYKARNKMGELCCSKDYEIKFKLMKGDLLMMDNYRTLHGRTSYNPKEGMRHLKGCYIDYDSSEGKLNHLIRKFKLENVTNQ